uniref:Uncharacterized protein n=1 Tax=Oryza sativa subsp. japonica TaxID=39947 RepID=Q6K2B5_ORYSJ|nr:hypothetical protein [Oryza sativa Japonica Group]BAD23701.1 hypothetical protein [Oryza sativa Japonica Group]
MGVSCTRGCLNVLKKVYTLLIWCKLHVHQWDKDECGHHYYINLKYENNNGCHYYVNLKYEDDNKEKDT